MSLQGEAAAERQQSRLAAKMENWKLAVEAKRRLIARENSDRERRLELFEAGAAGLEEAGGREEALRRFQGREAHGLRCGRRIWTTRDFEAVRVLGKGAFGTVHLVRRRGTKEYLALKQMPKVGYREKNLRARAYSEREILSATRNRWFVDLIATFQDADNFYMAMEFLQGGDLLTHLERKMRFSEEETRFYMAELLEAIDVVHTSGFVHRDIKPDNVVLSATGHLKLLDFGLCKPDPSLADEPQQTQEAGAPTRRQRMKSARGTPQYMAPEGLAGEVSPALDIWALGVMAFECLSGCVPFHAGHLEDTPESLLIITAQVRDHERVFAKRLQRAQAKGYVGPEAAQLLRGLVCDVGCRLGADACRQEPFFCGVDFSTLHLLTPPIIPVLDGPTDASYFPGDLGVERLPESVAGPAKDVSLEWTNYEFDREAHELQRPEAVSELFAGAEGRGTARSLPREAGA